MIPIAIAFLLGCVIGVLLIIISILARKRLPPWGIVFLAIVGILIIMICGTMFLCVGFVLR